MFDPKFFDEMAQRMAAAVPGARDLQQDLEKNFRALLQSAFAKMNLVTREEFDVQSDVLARTRAKVQALERQIGLLEERVLGKTRAEPVAPMDTEEPNQNGY